MHTVWGLYEQHPGEHGKLVSIFSSLDLAKNCQLIQPLLQHPWQSRDLGKGLILWRAAAIDPLSDGNQVFHFSIEEIVVDRLVQFPSLHLLSS
jgi:hypothetical protein